MLVSICVPVYNGERYIGQALDSVLAQDYPNIEIIVVNDGSNDGTANILKDYEAKGVQVIHQENKGQCVAANVAFRASRGAYVKFFDADDILSKKFISSQVQTLKGRNDAVASSAWCRFYNNDLSSYKLCPETVWKNMEPIEWIVESLRDRLNMMQCGIWLIPRDLISKAGLWDERLSLVNDFDFFIRILLSSQEVLFSDNAILYYRSGINGSLSGRKSPKALESAFLSISLGVQSILQFEDSARTRKICADTFQLWKYEFYPSHIELYEAAEKRINELGGSHLHFPSGGNTRLLSNMIGWKLTKRIKDILLN